MIARRVLLAVAVWLAVMPLALGAMAPRRAEAQAAGLPVVASCVAAPMCLAVIALVAASAGLAIAADDDVSLMGLYEEARGALPSWAQQSIVAAVQSGSQSFNLAGASGYDEGELLAALETLAATGGDIVSPSGTWAGTTGETVRYPNVVSANSRLLAYRAVTVTCDNFTTSGAACIGTQDATGIRFRVSQFDVESGGSYYVGVSRLVSGVMTCNLGGTYPDCVGHPVNGSTGGGWTVTGTQSNFDSSTTTLNAGGNVTGYTFRVNVATASAGTAPTWTTTGHRYQVPFVEWRLCNATVCSQYYPMSPIGWTTVAGVAVANTGTVAVPSGPVAIPRAGSSLVGIGADDFVTTPNGDTVTLVDPVPGVGGGSDTAATVGMLGAIYGVMSTIRDSVSGLGTFIADFPTVLTGALTDALTATLVPEVSLGTRVTVLTDILETKPPVSYLVKVQDAWADATTYGDDCPSVSIPYGPWSQTDFEMCLPTGVATWTRAFSQFVAAAGLAMWGWGFYRRLLE